jgi:hypothetical protein
VRDAQVDQSRFLDAGDDLDRVAECVAGAVHERAAAARLAQRVGADGAHALGAHVTQTLAEALEALQRAQHRLAVEPALLVEPRGETHRFAQAVDDHQLPVRVPGHDHVEAVRAQVDGREDVRDLVRQGPVPGSG